LIRRNKRGVILGMKALGMKVLIIGLVVFLFSTILILYVTWYQYNMYVIEESWNLADVKIAVTVTLFSDTLSVIGVLIAVIGMLILLRAPQKSESKPSA